MSVFRALKDYLHFNRGERRGLVVLFAILLGLILFNFFMPLFIPEKTYDFSAFDKAIREFELEQAMIRDSIEKNSRAFSRPKATEKELRPFPFDPNQLTEEKWLAMGLSEKQVKMIKNFEKKGGRFETADDLARIYSITQEEFRTLQPFIRINKPPETGWPGEAQKNKPDRPPPLPSNDDSLFQHPAPLEVDINLADTSALQNLHGVGPSFAKRIAAYRDLLGGYVRADQLLEVYGMDSLRYSGFVAQIRLDTGMVRKINVNTATIKEMIRHPYIEFYLAKAIVNYREKNGRIASLEKLQNEIRIPEDIYYKISPYLGLERQ